MSAQQVRETMDAYVKELQARGDYGRFFADDIEVEIMWADQRMRGREAAEQAVRYLHEVAFDAQPEFTSIFVDDHGAAAEAVFVGTHIGEFAGVAATGNSIRLPYSVFYEIDGDTITRLRIYLPMDELLSQIGAAADVEAAQPTR
jgi:predicted ester cyclase